MLRSFNSNIQKVIAHPRSVALLLYQEGMISEEVLNKPSSEKNTAIIYTSFFMSFCFIESLIHYF